MSTFTKSVEEIRDYLRNQKIKLYPIENDLLEEKDEYIKSLYLRMLCVLMRYGGEPSDMQVNYVGRIIAGIKAEEVFQTYMKKALDISSSDVEEFIDVFQEDDLKYYFCIDGCVLLVIVDSEDKQFELLAELLEVLGITKSELEYLSKVAKAYITHSSEFFEDAKTVVPVSLRDLSMLYYVKDFYTGTIIDCPEELHIYSHNKAEINLEKFLPIKAKNVFLENVIISLTQNLELKNYESVLFKDTTVKITSYLLGFESIDSVKFVNSVFENGTQSAICFNNCCEMIMRDSLFRDFTSRTIKLENVSQINFEDCTFERCDYRYRRSDSDWKSFGCVIYSSNPSINGINYLNGCMFLHCGGHNESNYYSSDFISNCPSKLNDCTFKLCWHFYSSNTLDPDYDSRRMFTYDTEAIDCTVINSAKIN